MHIVDKIVEVQKRLAEQGMDGWLLYDNHGSNRFVKDLLAIPETAVLTRRFCYWIPRKGEPITIIHRVEEDVLDSLPGNKEVYLSWTEYEQILASVLKKAKKIAMEYSPRNANPNVSVVDAGTIEMIREFDIEVMSSGNLLQHYTSVLDEEQIASHLEASSVLCSTLEHVWDFIADRLREGRTITEYEVQKFIQSEFTAHNCVTSDGPICAVGAHSAMPHYLATKKGAEVISKGDFILIDLWCKKDSARCVYADLTRVAVAAAEPTPKQVEIFSIVRHALQSAIDLVTKRMTAGKAVRGAELDDACRSVIEKHGYGAFFTHRTGHNIDTNVHGAGAHLDNLETADNRKILPGTCFSIEPGIYLPGEFGVRLEYNVLVGHDSSVKVTGGTEDSILCLL